MWNPVIRPYGEMFYKRLNKWDIAAQHTILRLDQSQGGTAVCMAVSLGESVIVTPSKYILMSLAVFRTQAEVDAAVNAGTAIESEYALMMQYMNTGTANRVFVSEEPIMRIGLSERLLDYPYVAVGSILANTETDGGFGSGFVDIFPHYVSAPRRY